MKGSNLLKDLLSLVACVVTLVLIYTGTISSLFKTIKSKNPQPETETTVAIQDFEIIDPNRPGYGLGSCRKLSENAHIVAIFLDDQENKWTQDEASAFLTEAVRPGLNFLEEQALLYDSQTELSLSAYSSSADISFHYDGIFPTHLTADGMGTFVDTTEEERLLLNMVVNELDFDSYEEMDDFFSEQKSVEQVGYLIIPKKAGLSYCRADREDNGYSGHEYSVIYSYDFDNVKTDQYDVARLVMQMFGAGYETESPAGRISSYSVAQQFYYYSIMFNHNGDESLNRIVDPYSAYTVGWLQRLPVENTYQDKGTASGIEEEYRKAYNKGTCRTLSEKIFVTVLFMDDAESSWDQQSIDVFWNETINPGLIYLCNMAANRGISLEFQSGYYASDALKGISLRYNGVIKENEWTADILDQAALSLGYVSKFELYEDLQTQTGLEQGILIVAINKQGRCRASSDSDTYHNDLIESCNLYKYHWTTGNVTSPATTAHEILHMFGAEDLYCEKATGDREHRESISQRLFPDDIMLKEYLDLYRNVIGPYTSYCIGWSHTLPQGVVSDLWWS